MRLTEYLWEYTTEYIKYINICNNKYMSISIEYINITKYVCIIGAMKVAVSLIPFINITVVQTYSFASYHTKIDPGQPLQKSSVKPRKCAYLQMRNPVNSYELCPCLPFLSNADGCRRWGYARCTDAREYRRRLRAHTKIKTLNNNNQQTTINKQTINDKSTTEIAPESV